MDHHKKTKECCKELEIEKLKKEIEEYKNKYLRALADYQNLEKRVDQQRKELIDIANKNLLLKILPILDNLEKAEIFIKDKGLKMIRDSFYQFLKSEGVEEIDVLGKEFNPQLAEAVEVILGDRDNIVVEVLRKGYEFNNTVLRVAQVRVSKRKIKTKAERQSREEMLKGDYM